jgi:hypothetical protein
LNGLGDQAGAETFAVAGPDDGQDAPGITWQPPRRRPPARRAGVARPRFTEIRQKSTVSQPMGMMAIQVASRKSITPAATWFTLVPPA